MYIGRPENLWIGGGKEGKMGRKKREKSDSSK